jgi:hypothetical protein
MASFTSLFGWSSDDPHNQLSRDPSRGGTEVDVVDPFALRPSPSMKPNEVVEAVLLALQRGDNDDIEAAWNFVMPNGELASQHKCSAGPMVSFRINVRREPRWHMIGRRPCAALLRTHSFQVLGGVMTDADVMLYRVKASPSFPDAPECESEVSFNWELVRQRQSSHPSADDSLGELNGCWMVNSIEPDYSAWFVKDPIGAGRAPDFFTHTKKPGHNPGFSP